MKFKNKKGKTFKTTMSDDIINQVSDIVEQKLKAKGIFYIRNSEKFRVQQNDVNNLLRAQMEANEFLMKSGVITLEMIAKEIDKNF